MTALRARWWHTTAAAPESAADNELLQAASAQVSADVTEPLRFAGASETKVLTPPESFSSDCAQQAAKDELTELHLASRLRQAKFKDDISKLFWRRYERAARHLRGTGLTLLLISVAIIALAAGGASLLPALGGGTVSGAIGSGGVHLAIRWWSHRRIGVTRPRADMADKDPTEGDT